MKNIRKSKHTFVVKRTPYGAGRGLFATGPIKKADFIIEYIGEKLPNSIADTLGTRYLFDLENGFTIDGSPMWNTARWINHSCKPNAETELDEEKGRVYVFATRAIEAGEEITMDYGDEYVKDFISPMGCRCEVCIGPKAEKPKKKLASASARQ